MLVYLFCYVSLSLGSSQLTEAHYNSTINLMYCPSQADHKENEIIHAQGLIFCLEMIITHISYGHHFMTLMLFFYILIILRIWIKALLVSLRQFLISNLALEQPGGEIHDITAVGKLKKKKKTLVWSMEGQPNILCKPILFFSSLENEPLLLPLSPKPVLKFSKATVNPSAGNWNLFTMIYGLQNHNMLYIIKLNSPHGYSSIHCDCIIAKGFSSLGGGFEMLSTGHQDKFQKELPNLCTTCNQHTTGISLVYDQVKRKHLNTTLITEASWDLLHVNCWQLSKLFFGVIYLKIMLHSTVSYPHQKKEIKSNYKNWPFCMNCFCHEVWVAPLNPTTNRKYFLSKVRTRGRGGILIDYYEI
ncbi:putative signal peptide protein [Puccinia sorghi]|uniref:Putative signal peptide protein n=1 Tax=Puccinia sorghi TaxID=27349 RepID=A0A0L6UC98_9BASI|nr:putative signal peptide protein [Puccinia sorghi]